MKISGFTFLRNASKLFYPVRESIESILPLVDEFVVALGDCEPDDDTQALLDSIDSDKLVVIPTTWDTNRFPRNSEYARQTDIAMRHCSGDWLFYIQSDEVIHEQDHAEIVKACRQHLDSPHVEGFLFQYNHFWGDYDHCHDSHAVYPKEIRIVRRRDDIHSWKDAQSFRVIPHYEERWEHYFEKEGTRKLNVVELNAAVYHYGGCRPPDYMARKNRAFHTSYHNDSVKAAEHDFGALFDYGPLNRIPLFNGTHPAIMAPRIAEFDWGHMLQYRGSPNPGRRLHKHEKLKARLLTFIEQRILMGKTTLGGFKNYTLLKP